MPEAVGHKRNEILWFAELIEDHFDNVQIHHLAVAAKIVNLSRFSFEKHGDNGGTMIVHVDPIAHIHAVAVHRERLVAQRLDYHERN